MSAWQNIGVPSHGTNIDEECATHSWICKKHIEENTPLLAAHHKEMQTATSLPLYMSCTSDVWTAWETTGRQCSVPTLAGVPLYPILSAYKTTSTRHAGVHCKQLAYAQTYFTKLPTNSPHFIRTLPFTNRISTTHGTCDQVIRGLVRRL